MGHSAELALAIERIIISNLLAPYVARAPPRPGVPANTLHEAEALDYALCYCLVAVRKIESASIRAGFGSVRRAKQKKPLGKTNLCNCNRNGNGRLIDTQNQNSDL